jgi:hypothetical protein
MVNNKIGHFILAKIEKYEQLLTTNRHDMFKTIDKMTSICF